jgi:hypothetical protein
MRKWTMLAVSLLLGYFSASAVAQPRQIRAQISAKCEPVSGDFTVAVGQTASGFQIAGLAGGTSCGTGIKMKEYGFRIDRMEASGKRRILRYSVESNGRVSQLGGSLATLTLTPGSYRLWMSGGRNGGVTLTFKLQGAVGSAPPPGRQQGQAIRD